MRNSPCFTTAIFGFFSEKNPKVVHVGRVREALAVILVEIFQRLPVLLRDGVFSPRRQDSLLLEMEELVQGQFAVVVQTGVTLRRNLLQKCMLFFVPTVDTDLLPRVQEFGDEHEAGMLLVDSLVSVDSWTFFRVFLSEP